MVPEDELEVLYECEARYHQVKHAPQSATTVEGVRRSAECAGLLLTPKEGRYESQDESAQHVMFCQNALFYVPNPSLVHSRSMSLPHQNLWHLWQASARTATSNSGGGVDSSMYCSAVLFSHHEGGRGSMGAAWHAPCTVREHHAAVGNKCDGGGKWLVTFFKVLQRQGESGTHDRDGLDCFG